MDLNRGYACERNINPALSETDTHERKESFHDLVVSANSSAMEQFWYTVNKYSHCPSEPCVDGEAEYAGEATTAALAIGRITCPVTSHSFSGVENPHIKPGSSHKPRGTAASGTVKEKFSQAINKIRDTQCDDPSCSTDKHQGEEGVCTPTNGVRKSTTVWPLLEGETNLNDAGGLCGMPTQFLGSVKVGGLHRTARFMEVSGKDSLRDSLRKRFWSTNMLFLTKLIRSSIRFASLVVDYATPFGDGRVHWLLGLPGVQEHDEDVHSVRTNTHSPLPCNSNIDGPRSPLRDQKSRHRHAR